MRYAFTLITILASFALITMPVLAETATKKVMTEQTSHPASTEGDTSVMPMLFSESEANPNFNWPKSLMVYKDASLSEFGRASVRSSQQIPLTMKQFKNIEEVLAPGGGIQTAVLVTAGYPEMLNKLFAENGPVLFTQDMILSQHQDKNGKKYITLRAQNLGLSFSFRFEKSPTTLISQVARLYERKGWTKHRAEVIARYRDSYIITIRSAPDFVAPRNKITIEEAMAMANLIGAADQPLWGIPDGKNMLAKFEKMLMVKNWRKIEKQHDAYNDFLSELQKEPGDYVQNLFRKFVSSFPYVVNKKPDLTLPEDIFAKKSSDSSSAAMFFYDVLRRNSYQVRIIVVEQNWLGYNQYMLAYRRVQSDKWSIVSYDIDLRLRKNISEDLKTIPILFYPNRESVPYFEADVGKLFLDHTTASNGNNGISWRSYAKGQDEIPNKETKSSAAQTETKSPAAQTETKSPAAQTETKSPAAKTETPSSTEASMTPEEAPDTESESEEAPDDQAEE